MGEGIKHHMKEERNELFPKIKESDMDLETLGEKMWERRSALLKVRH